MGDALKHTPGPWGVKEDDFDDAWHVTPDGLGPCDFGEWVPVAVCDNGEGSEANARLIAAAPDMLHALRSAADEFRILGARVMTETSMTSLDCAYAECVEAIEKAEGKP